MELKQEEKEKIELRMLIDRITWLDNLSMNETLLARAIILLNKKLKSIEDNNLG